MAGLLSASVRASCMTTTATLLPPLDMAATVIPDPDT
jgi:hypothetical protein